MKAVNLIPADARKNRGGSGGGLKVPTYAFLGVLAAALALVTMYVLANNKISDRQAQLTSLQAQVSQAQAESTHLANYAKFEQIARTRVQTVAGIAATRLDWHTALNELAQVVPANTSLQSLTATIAPGASTGAGSSAGVSSGAGNLRTDLQVPALELVGCTRTQDDVARFMSRLRLIDNVTRVTLGNSQKTESMQDGATASASPGSSSAQGCGPNKPSFDLVVFFKAVDGAGPSGAASLPATTVGGTQ